MAEHPTRLARALTTPEADDLVGLESFVGASPHELSGGMQSRGAIARALAYDPSVLLMDEPFAGLDALTRDEMQRTLVGVWRETRKTILDVTHNVAEASTSPTASSCSRRTPGRCGPRFASRSSARVTC